MAILHRIKARLYKNRLTPDPDDYVIRAEAERTLGVRLICDSAVTRGDANISYPKALPLGWDMPGFQPLT